MPLPLLLGGIVALGVGAHLDAKDINEKAQKILDGAKTSYYKQKLSLETQQKQMDSKCKILGLQKKKIMETSVRRFLDSYEKIKNVSWKTDGGSNEIEIFAISDQEQTQFCEMLRACQSLSSDVATTATAGAMIFFALRGFPLGMAMSAAFGMAEDGFLEGMGAAASAVALSAFLPGLSAIAVPAIFFTGISASIKADENLEKAKAEKAKAECAIEEMKNSEILCQGIMQRAEMFHDLLDKLDEIFKKCVCELDETVRQKTIPFQQKIEKTRLTEKDIQLIAVTRSLAGAIKSVIEMPIINQFGRLSKESMDKHEQIKKSIPEFERKANSVL